MIRSLDNFFEISFFGGPDCKRANVIG
jgi:hypothetical protein